MKRIYTLILSICMLFNIMPISAKADEAVHVEGLAECLDAIIGDKSLSEELKGKIMQQEKERFDKGWPSFWHWLWTHGQRLYIKEEGRYTTEEEEYEYRWNIDKPTFENKLKISVLNREKYLNQYAQEGKMSYLFNEKNIGERVDVLRMMESGVMILIIFTSLMYGRTI